MSESNDFSISDFEFVYPKAGGKPMEALIYDRRENPNIPMRIGDIIPVSSELAENHSIVGTWRIEQINETGKTAYAVRIMAMINVNLPPVEMIRGVKPWE